jgi:hypothetical protein
VYWDGTDTRPLFPTEFLHISTPSKLAKAKDAVRALRPDLEFIEFPRNGR